MKLKKLLCTMLTVSLVGTSLIGCGKTQSSENETKQETDVAEGTTLEGATGKITLMTIDTTFNEKFDAYIQKAEEATGIEIEVITCPTNTDDRQAKITTILSSADTSVDVITVNDEMISAFKNTGFLEPLQDSVMTSEVVAQFPQEYMKDMVIANGNTYSVPMYMEVLAFWVNEAKLKAAGLTEIKTKEDFEAYVVANTKDGNFGYGGAWEKTYVFNEIGTFVNLFGGDYYDWTNPKSREAVEFLYNMAKEGQTPISQLADQYDPMMQKFFDENYGSIFMYTGAMQTFIDSGKYGPEGVHLAPMPTFETSSAYLACWHYVLNSASENKEAATKFLSWAASAEGEKAYYEMSTRLPARSDVINDSTFSAEGIEEIRGYLENTVLRGRPMAPQAMEFIGVMGSLFQQYVADELTLDEFCVKAQGEVNNYITK